MQTGGQPGVVTRFVTRECDERECDERALQGCRQSRNVVSSVEDCVLWHSHAMHVKRTSATMHDHAMHVNKPAPQCTATLRNQTAKRCNARHVHRAVTQCMHTAQQNECMYTVGCDSPADNACRQRFREITKCRRTARNTMHASPTTHTHTHSQRTLSQAWPALTSATA